MPPDVIGKLRGNTWGHPRGLSPLVACAEEFRSLCGVEIEWVARSLQGFADVSITNLAERYDLVVFDHPHLGEIVASESYWCLTDLVSEEVVGDWRDSVGPSFDSYVDPVGRLWGAPIDVAGTVSASRPDLLERIGIPIPTTWSDYFALAKSASQHGHAVAVPLLPIDSLTALLTLLANRGVKELFEGEFAPLAVLTEELERLQEIASVSHPMSLSSSPIDVLEEMAEGTQLLYSPLTFGYNNYSRPSFRKHTLSFGAFPTAFNSTGGGTLGGAGLGISRHSKNLAEAIQFVEYVASPAVQSTVYVANQGQPASRRAWTSPDANALTENFFRDTLDLIERQYLRPRYSGYLYVQDHGGHAIHDYLSGNGSARLTANTLNRIVRLSRTQQNPLPHPLPLEVNYGNV